MEKIRVHGATKYVGKVGTNKHENYLGPRVPKWFGKELANLAAKHDVLDDENKPQAWTAADIPNVIQDNLEYNQMVVSALLDKSSARQIVSQIAMLSRLRVLLIKHSEKDFRVMLQQAIKNSKREKDEWEDRPDWWDESSDEHAFLLLQKLNQYGFTQFMQASKARDGFGNPNEDYDDMIALKLSKPSIQTKANQLVRELHGIEDHANMIKMVEKRRKSCQKFDSLAVCSSGHVLSSKSTSSSPNGDGSNGKAPPQKATVQTGLKAFFSAASSSKKKSSSASDGSDSTPPTGSKRKQSPGSVTAVIDVDSDENSSPTPVEKKAKTETPYEPQTLDPQQQQMEIDGEIPQQQ